MQDYKHVQTNNFFYYQSGQIELASETYLIVPDEHNEDIGNNHDFGKSHEKGTKYTYVSRQKYIGPIFSEFTNPNYSQKTSTLKMLLKVPQISVYWMCRL